MKDFNKCVEIVYKNGQSMMQELSNGVNFTELIFNKEINDNLENSLELSDCVSNLISKGLVEEIKEDVFIFNILNN